METEVRVGSFAMQSCREHARPCQLGRNVPLHRGGMRKSVVLICPTAQGLIVQHVGTTGSSRMACMREVPVGQVRA